MTRRGGRRSGRGSRPPARRANPPQSPPLRWWNRITKTILGAGALATAIAAVLALVLHLLPSHSQENVARISVQGLSPVSLSQYLQRSAASQTQAADDPKNHRLSLVVAVIGQTSAPSQAVNTSNVSPSPSVTAPSPSPSVTTPMISSSGIASSTTTTSPSTTISPSGTAAPIGGPAGSSGIVSLAPPGMSSQGACSSARQVIADVREKMPRVFLPQVICPALVIVTTVNSHDKPVSSAAAASSIIGILSQTRTASGPSGAPKAQQDPLGEQVNVNLELVGLRGQPVLLSWSIFQAGSHTNLFGKWLGDFVADRLEATTNDDTGTLAMWIPLPKLPGPYFIHLSLTADGAGLASVNSDTFS